jgi:hypothetical protein
MRKKSLEILIVTAITDRTRKQNHLTLLSLLKPFDPNSDSWTNVQTDRFFYVVLHTDRKTGRHTDRETDMPASRHTDRLAVIQKGLETD